VGTEGVGEAGEAFGVDEGAVVVFEQAEHLVSPVVDGGVGEGTAGNIVEVEFDVAVQEVGVWKVLEAEEALPVVTSLDCSRWQRIDYAVEVVSVGIKCAIGQGAGSGAAIDQHDGRRFCQKVAFYCAISKTHLLAHHAQFL
jgi:hypothetical protein